MAVNPTLAVVQNLRQRIGVLGQTAPEDLVRAQALGELSFASAQVDFQRTRDLLERVDALKLETASLDELNELGDGINRLETAVSHMREFSLTAGASQERRDHLLREYRESYRIFATAAAKLIALYEAREGVDQLVAEERRRVAEFEQAAQDALGRIRDAEAKSSQTLESVQRAAGQIGVQVHSKQFDDEAHAQQVLSRWWLAATVLLAVATAAWALFALLNPLVSTDAPLSVAVQVAVAKVLVFSVIASSALWAARNYRACWHNYIVNRHRANALNTFTAFVNAATDEATRNGVLLEATRAIFAPQASGYISTEPDGHPTTQVLEVIRGLGSRGAP